MIICDITQYIFSLILPSIWNAPISLRPSFSSPSLACILAESFSNVYSSLDANTSFSSSDPL